MTRDSTDGPHVLVPLDGSAFAEQALSIAADVASALGVTLLLGRVTSPASLGARPEQAQGGAIALLEPVAVREMQAERYLERIAQQMRRPGLHIHTIATTGDPASELLRLISPEQTRLIVMTTHGRTGMARAALGSVADRLVRESCMPVLLLRLQAGQLPHRNLGRALVPLDGSPFAEAALDAAVMLAGSIVHAITLLRVVPLTRDWPTERALQEADSYLDGVRTRLAKRLEERATVQTQALTGFAADTIIWRASHDFDVVIMATHGEAGTRRWAFGSVADRVLHDSPTPLVLVCPRPH